MVDVKTTNATTKDATNKYARSTSSAFRPGRAGEIAEDKLPTHPKAPRGLSGAYTLSAFTIEYDGRLNPDRNRLLQAAAIRTARYLFPQYPAVTSEEETKCG